MQLAVADVERDHPGRSTLEQGVREAAGRGAQVEGVASRRVDAELVEGVRELLAAAGDEAWRALDLERRVLGELLAGLAVAGHETGQHERLRLGTALGEPALHQQHVEPLLHGRRLARRTRPTRHTFGTKTAQTRDFSPGNVLRRGTRGAPGGTLAYIRLVELRGEHVVLRPLRAEDAPRLADLAADPEVARWWPNLREPELVRKAKGTRDAKAFAVLLDEEPIGLVQYHEDGDPEYRHAGIDLFLGTPYQGRGLGTDTVRTIARHLIDDRGHHRLTIDPVAHNARAIRCYEKVGFRPVGVLRKYQRDPDGTWRDGLLLDLLAGELTSS